MERQPVLGVPKASRVQPAPADDTPVGPRLPLRLMALGVVLLLSYPDPRGGSSTTEATTTASHADQTGATALR